MEKITKELALLASLIALCISPGLSARELKSDEEIIYLLTTAAWNEQDKRWQVSLHGWIFESEQDSLWRNGAMTLLEEKLELKPQGDEAENLQRRGWPFLVDNEGGKTISLRLAGSQFTLPPSQANGHIYAQFTVMTPEAADGNTTTWLTYHTVMPEGDTRQFTGQVQLVSTKGLSVISDIDDTIKLSNVLDKQALMENTFLREFQAIPGMAALYQKWEDQGAVFHYLTGSPWQLYPALHEFIIDHDFPRGSFTMRHFRLKDGSLLGFIGSSYDYKVSSIETLIQHYPQRDFILVGDSGEKDPEVYGEIARRYPQQIRAIYIHNVDSSDSTSERYKKAFASIAKSRWQLFDNTDELKMMEKETTTEEQQSNRANDSAAW